MAELHADFTGTVVAIWRYPVKSMMGEELNATEVTELGLLGDRALALVDAENGKVVSAKNPRRWPNLFDFRAAYVEPPRHGHMLPPTRITLPDGETVSTDEDGLAVRLSASLGRMVRLTRSPFDGARAEEYRPDYDWLNHRDETIEFQLPAGTLFDCALVHVVTTATLDRVRSIAPASRFEPRRFRPNFIIQTPAAATGFVENDWIGRSLRLGNVLLHVTGPCPRCVMTTLAQGDLPKDPGVLRTAVQHNQGNVGVYASVVRGPGSFGETTKSCFPEQVSRWDRDPREHYVEERSEQQPRPHHMLQISRVARASVLASPRPELNRLTEKLVRQFNPAQR